MMQHAMTKHKTLIFVCFGIAIGLCIGTVLKNYRALEIVKDCNLRQYDAKSPLEIIGLDVGDTIHNSQHNLVFVGVMTAKNFIDGRAKAVYDTWGKEVPGRIAFFSSEGTFSRVLPVIGLKNVDDRYPPQKKSFMMLHYMYEHFVDKFEWFIRSDDDVYIEPLKLERFLRSIDSSKPQFIGQAGQGNSKEFGLLSLEFDENFCMGGPGVILSSETLRRVAPHIPTCLKNLYSTHEDVEIGRCVQKYAGIPCTWNYEMQYILRHNSSGMNAFTGKLKRKEIYNAISLHPIKRSPLMYRLHSYIQGLKAEEMRQESLELHRDLKRMTTFLELANNNEHLTAAMPTMLTKENSNNYFGDHFVLGMSPNLNKFAPTSTEDLLEWSFMARSLYSTEHSNPKHKIDSALRESLEDVINEIMDNINNYSRQRGRVIEFREILYGYTRVNPLHGHDLILDLLLIYKKYRGKKMTVPVRRHVYIQRSFTGIFVKEMQEKLYTKTLRDSDMDDIRQNSSTRSQAFSSRAFFSRTTSDAVHPPVAGWRDGAINKSKIVFVLPIADRYQTFKRFVENYERVAIEEDGDCELLVVIFGDDAAVIDHLLLLQAVRQRRPYHRVRHIHRKEKFSRGVALNTAVRSTYIRDNDIILFIDVDMRFQLESLQRIRYNTLRGRQVYLPIVFSQYDPQRRAPPLTDAVTNESGYFRQFGYGICAIYKSDILDEDIAGFDMDITGWGLEDVKFLDKIVKVANRPDVLLVNTAEAQSRRPNASADDDVRRLGIFRAPDPSFIHIYHDIVCDVNLEATQYNMCLGTKANSMGNTRLLDEIFFEKKENLDFIIEYNQRKKKS